MHKRVVEWMSILLGVVLVSIALWIGASFVLSCTSPTTVEDSWDYQDQDHDGIRNGIDADVDGDGWANWEDALPYDPRYY